MHTAPVGMWIPYRSADYSLQVRAYRKVDDGKKEKNQGKLWKATPPLQKHCSESKENGVRNERRRRMQDRDWMGRGISSLISARYQTCLFQLPSPRCVCWV